MCCAATTESSGGRPTVANSSSHATAAGSARRSVRLLRARQSRARRQRAAGRSREIRAISAIEVPPRFETKASFRSLYDAMLRVDVLHSPMGGVRGREMVIMLA